MPTKDTMERLLAAKRAASAVCDDFLREKEAAELTEPRVVELVERFIWAKFRLSEEEAAPAERSLEKLAQASLAKMLRIAPELVTTEDRAANCDGADSATVKQALMIMALKREFQVEFDCFRAGLCHSVDELASLIWKAL